MSSTTSMKISIITRVDERYIYIWDTNSKVHELRFPFKSIPNAQPGDLVRYKQKEDPRGVQFQNDIRRYEKGAPFEIVKTSRKDVYFTVKTTLVFSPYNYKPYRDRIDACEPCKAIAYSMDFHEVAVFVDLDYTSNVAYEAYICRIPTNYDFVVSSVKTLFCLTLGNGKKNGDFLRVVDNENVLNEVPWKSCSAEIDVDFMMGSPVDGTSSTQSQQLHTATHTQGNIIDIDGDNESGESFFNYRFSKEDGEVASYAGSGRYRQVHSRLTDMSDDFDIPCRRNLLFVDEGYGVIVRLKKDYAVLWSKIHGLVWAEGPSGYNHPLGTWVNYKCRENTTLYVEDGCLTKSAYDLKEITPPRISYKLENIVKCQAIVRLLLPSSDNFLLTEDEVFGVVFCSRDSYLLTQFRNNASVEVFVVFIENFCESSNWIAIAANHGRDDWRKLENLPERINEIATSAFVRPAIAKDAEEMCRIDERRFGPPADWICARHVNDKTIEDVLGVVICHEKNKSVSVAFTIFGLARLRTFIDLGTWLRMTIEKESDLEYFSNVSALTSQHYRVLLSQKIRPVMSTRVVSPKGDEKVLICGIVNGVRCLENAYLGEIIDDGNTKMYPNGLLVEFSAFNRKNGWCWELLQSHGAATNVDHVPLEMSVFCKYVGRTCDDAHTLLVNPKYTDSYLKKSSRHAPSDKPIGNERLIEPISSSNGNFFESLNNVGRVNSFVHMDKARHYRYPVEIRTEMEGLQKLTPVQYLLNKNDTMDVDEELRRYEPEIVGSKTRGMCLITKKHDVFALAYSKRFEIVLFKPNIFKSVDKFHEYCRPGKWIKAYFSKVKSDNSGYKKQLRFDYIAVRIAKLTEELPRTRLTDGFLQVYISCVFNDKTVSEVGDDPSQLIVDTALGSVLLSETLYRKSGFYNTEQSVWVTHIRKKYGCHWKFVLNDILLDYDHEFQLLQKHIHEQRSQSSQELLETDLLLPDAFNEHAAISDVSLFSSSLKPHELLAGFGLKSSKKNDTTASTSTKVPKIAELVMEELQVLKCGGESTMSSCKSEQTENSVNERKRSAGEADVKINYHYAGVEDEVNRMNNDCVAISQELTNNEKFIDSSDKYSLPELLSAKSYIANSQTSFCDTQTRSSEAQHDNKMEQIASQTDSGGWFQSDKIETVKISTKDPAHVNQIALLKQLQEDLHNNSTESLYEPADEMDDHFEEALDLQDGIARVNIITTK